MNDNTQDMMRAYHREVPTLGLPPSTGVNTKDWWMSRGFTPEEASEMVVTSVNIRPLFLNMVIAQRKEELKELDSRGIFGEERRQLLNLKYSGVLDG